ncbi:MAG: Gfo/Idh/MocA family oxidoreductase [Acetobacteraceae bacterium]
MNQPFRIGIVGSGAVARLCHVPAVLASPLAALSATVDPVTERARSVAREYGVDPVVASSLEHVLDKVDGLIIATPNHTHAPLALAAIAAGVPCLIEKPLCITEAEGRRVCEAAERGGVVVAAGYCLRFNEGVVLVKQLLDEGSLGAVRQFHFQDGSVGGWSPESGYILNRESAGGGVMTVTGSHHLDRMLYWFGYPDEALLQHDGSGGPEAHCHATIRYRSRGLRIDGSMLFSKLVRLDAGVAVRTELGTLATGVLGSPVLWRRSESPAVTAELRSAGIGSWDPRKTVFQRQLEDFIEACRGEHPPAVPAETGLQSVRLISALYGTRLPTSGEMAREETA